MLVSRVEKLEQELAFLYNKFSISTISMVNSANTISMANLSNTIDDEDNEDQSITGHHRLLKKK